MTWLYLALIAAAIAWHLMRRQRSERAHHEALQQSVAAGLNEPPSLHPKVDPARCIGSGGCLKACPEEALGMVGGKAVLINASACIGHGACEAACPHGAIQLVFGTEKRGIDIPVLQPDFQTNVPGLFIAGELGGMGLIRKAAGQGQQAIGHIARYLREAPANEAGASASATDGSTSPHWLDVLIIGAGPAGLAAGLAATDQKLAYRILEQEPSLGGAIFHYPRQKIAMTAPMTLPLVGLVKMSEISKEALLDFWQGVVQRFALDLHLDERMERVEAVPGGFAVHTARGLHHSRSVLLAIGRRGTPRTLGVPGEDLPKVTYRLIDPAQYRDQQVLVVGGGDSALEAALALAAEPGTGVTLSYRSEAFSRVKPKNRDALLAAEAAGRLQVRLKSQVMSLQPESATLRLADGSTVTRPNDAVIVCAGGVLPTPLLQAMGVRFETKHGQA